MPGDVAASFCDVLGDLNCKVPRAKVPSDQPDPKILKKHQETWLRFDTFRAPEFQLKEVLAETIGAVFQPPVG